MVATLNCMRLVQTSLLSLSHVLEPLSTCHLISTQVNGGAEGMVVGPGTEGWPPPSHHVQIPHSLGGKIGHLKLQAAGRGILGMRREIW